MARLHSCVEELRSIPGEGCIKGAARESKMLQQAVLDSLQQFKQFIRHTSTGNQACNNTSVEVNVDGAVYGFKMFFQIIPKFTSFNFDVLKHIILVC